MMDRYIHFIGDISEADINKALTKPTTIFASPYSTTVTTIRMRIDDPTNVDDGLEMIMWWMYDTIRYA